MPLIAENTACNTWSEAPLYIYQIMGLAAVNARAKERPPKGMQHGAAEAPDSLTLHLHL